MLLKRKPRYPDGYRDLLLDLILNLLLGGADDAAGYDVVEVRS